MFYTKPPLEEPSLKKKSKKKNTNSHKAVFLQEEEAKAPLPQEKFSEDDYVNDLNEYEEELLNSAFLESGADFSANSQDFCSTCSEILSLFQEKSLEKSCDYEHMLSVCQENAKWYLPIQAA